MAKTKKAKKNKNDIKDVIKKTCNNCKRELNLIDFYNTGSPMFADGKVPICKKCIKADVDESDINTVLRILRIIDKPFLSHVWLSCKEKSEVNVLGNYLRIINSLSQYKGATWNDGDKNVLADNIINDAINKTKDKSEPIVKENFEITNEIEEKWGFGYTSLEYKYFEKKYYILKKNYPIRTAMHDEALKTYVRYRIKEEIATAQGLIKDAKEWGKLAQESARDAKINPSQLSKADLQDGLGTFGELARAVEQAIDIIPILPKFIAKPQDKVDFNIWQYVNYIRDLKGLPPCEYSEIYDWYKDRLNEYKEREKTIDIEDINETEGDNEDDW